MSNEILLEKDEGIAVITLNRPERFNSMTTAMYDELPRIVDTEKALELMLSRELIGAEEALRIGLVGKVYPHDQFMDEAKKFAGMIASGPSAGIELTKRAIQRSFQNDLKTQLDFETYAQNICRQTQDHKEGVKAFADKRKPVFEGK